MIANHHDSPGIREIVLVMGMTGWGKSWWTKLYHRLFNRVLVYDPAASFPCQYDDIDTIVEDLLAKDAPKMFNRGFIEGDDVVQAGGLSFALGNNLLIVEECATVFEKGLARMPEWCKRLVFYGRHRGCSLVLIAQRPTYIPIDFRSQSNRVITFCQHEGADTDWLQDFYGKERCKRLSSIPKFTCFDYHNGQVSEYSIVDKVEQVFGVKLDNRVSTELPSFV